ncbi:hypothetical protein H7H51_12160 [Mycolicibacterium farcinogenes]|nr:hypothetical protein [Mycolicibacterium farcinogenes]
MGKITWAAAQIASTTRHRRYPARCGAGSGQLAVADHREMPAAGAVAAGGHQLGQIRQGTQPLTPATAASMATAAWSRSRAAVSHRRTTGAPSFRNGGGWH